MAPIAGSIAATHAGEMCVRMLFAAPAFVTMVATVLRRRRALVRQWRPIRDNRSAPTDFTRYPLTDFTGLRPH